MAYVVLDKLKLITPLLALYHLTPNDWAVMWVIGGIENDEARKAIIAGKKRESTWWWCRASIETIAHEFGLSPRTVIRSLKKMEVAVTLDELKDGTKARGFIDVVRTRGKRVADRRKVNLEKLDELIAKLEDFEAEYKKARYGRDEVLENELDNASEYDAEFAPQEAA